MAPTPLLGFALLATLALVLPGCGEEGRAAPNVTAARQRQAGGGCPKQLGAFVDSLAGLRRRLAVGLSYDQYVAAVRGLRSSYGQIPVRRLTLGCLGTGRPSEKALNEHIDAVNAWGECLADAACTTATIEPVLQRRWRMASRHLSEAR